MLTVPNTVISEPLSGVAAAQHWAVRLTNDRSAHTKQPFAQLVAVSHTSSTLGSFESARQSAPDIYMPEKSAGGAEPENATG
jgi:hypothetical protein